jgi:hypothetical protein
MHVYEIYLCVIDRGEKVVGGSKKIKYGRGDNVIGKIASHEKGESQKGERGACQVINGNGMRKREGK